MKFGCQHLWCEFCHVRDCAGGFHAAKHISGRLRKECISIEEIRPAEHIECGALGRKCIWDVRFRPTAHLGNLVLFQPRPGCVKKLCMLLPRTFLGQRHHRRVGRWHQARQQTRGVVGGIGHRWGDWSGVLSWQASCQQISEQGDGDKFVMAVHFGGRAGTMMAFFSRKASRG